ncbi:hypothetical protein LguiA_007302 [Lonicera macranthoides]
MPLNIPNPGKSLMVHITAALMLNASSPYRSQVGTPVSHNILSSSIIGLINTLRHFPIELEPNTSITSMLNSFFIHNDGGKLQGIIITGQALYGTAVVP